MLRRFRSWLPAVLLGGVILALEFVALEVALRAYGGSESSSPFQALFMQDPRVGHRPRPDAHARYTTVEFSTDLSINRQGVRDDDDIGPKAANERRVVLLGDSLVLAVQVPFNETFGEQLESRLNGTDAAHQWRVINAGVQGYGPVESWLFFDHVIADLQPDVVVVVVFVGNDAVEAADARAKLEAGRVPAVSTRDATRNRLRVLVRRSQVLQLVRVRVDQLRARLTTAVPERPLASYLDDAPEQVIAGFDVAREAFDRLAQRASAIGAETVFVLMPARFQTDDDDYGRLATVVEAAGGRLERHLATERFLAALEPLDRPTLDLLPILWTQDARSELFFQRNVHLTPRGHRVVADALFQFLDSQGVTHRNGR